MIRDLALPYAVLTQKLPDIVVEHLDFARTIKGREWRVKATNAESESNVIKAHFMDINVFEATTKRSAHITA
jgi:hypothetical protein